MRISFLPKLTSAYSYLIKILFACQKPGFIRPAHGQAPYLMRWPRCSLYGSTQWTGNVLPQRRPLWWVGTGLWRSRAWHSKLWAERHRRLHHEPHQPGQNATLTASIWPSVIPVRRTARHSRIQPTGFPPSVKTYWPSIRKTSVWRKSLSTLPRWPRAANITISVALTRRKSWQRIVRVMSSSRQPSPWRTCSIKSTCPSALMEDIYNDVPSGMAASGLLVGTDSFLLADTPIPSTVGWNLFRDLYNWRTLNLFPTDALRSLGAYAEPKSEPGNPGTHGSSLWFFFVRSFMRCPKKGLRRMS